MKRNIFCLIALLSVTFSLSAQKTSNQSFNDVQEIKINISAGDLVINRSNNKTVTVSVEYDASEVEPLVKQNGKKLTIDEKSLKKNRNGELNWTIDVPDERIITVNIGAGSASYNGIYVKLDHNTGAGGVSLSEVSGKLKVNTGTGNIKVSQSRGDFNLNSGTGSLLLDSSEGGFVLNSGTGNVSVKSSDIRSKTTLNSGTGNVSLVASRALEAELSLNSGTGDAMLSFGGQTISGDFEMSCSEKNGSISAPFDFDKTETVDNGGRNNKTLKKYAKVGEGTPKIKVSTGTGKASVKK